MKDDARSGLRQFTDTIGTFPGYEHRSDSRISTGTGSAGIQEGRTVGVAVAVHRVTDIQVEYRIDARAAPCADAA